MRKLLLLLIATPLLALVSITSTADIAGTGTATAISSSGGALWIQFVCPSTNVSSVRIGDSGVSTTDGVPCAPGGSFFMPVLPVQGVGSNHVYDLSKIFFLVQVGDKLSITRANP
jgi:hypothetical protein